MAKIRRREKRPPGELIITSLVDIALCLVLGFMVSMPAFIESGIFVTSPSIQRASTTEVVTGKVDDVKVNIYLADGGRIFLNEEVVSEAYLIKTLPDLLARSTSRQVIVGADFNVKYGPVIKVLDVAKQAGAGQLALLRRKRA